MLYIEYSCSVVFKFFSENQQIILGLIVEMSKGNPVKPHDYHLNSYLIMKADQTNYCVSTHLSKLFKPLLISMVGLKISSYIWLGPGSHLGD